MRIVESAEINTSDGKRKYRIRYVDKNGDEQEFTRDVPDEISYTSTMSDMVKNLILWLIIAVLMMSGFQTLSKSKDYVSSAEIKNKILLAVNNGADLDVIRNIYSNREVLDTGIFGFFESHKSEYLYSLPLSSILDDVKSDLYMAKDKPDTDIVNSIDSLISKHSQKNPFDKLTKQQKDYFDNVRQKVGEKYHLIQNDMNNISDELDSKNILVTAYLSDSKTSLYVSIFSLLFALIVSSYQIYQGRPKKVAEHLKTLVDGIFLQKNEKNSEDEKVA